jgi:hypothetical protein
MKRTVVSLLSTRSVVLFGAMILALALIALSLGTSARQADAATRLVTKTFTNSGQILIRADAVLPECTTSVSGPATPYPSEKNVTFPSGSHIRDVNLTLKNYTHTFPDDVDVLLKKGTHNRTVMSDVGSNEDVSNITLVLNDEATSALPNNVGLVGGSFKPRNVEDNPDGGGDQFPAPAPTQDTRSALSGFDTLNPNGTWKLFVQDDGGGDCGKFGGGWSLRIKAAVPA